MKTMICDRCGREYKDGSDEGYIVTFNLNGSNPSKTGLELSSVDLCEGCLYSFKREFLRSEQPIVTLHDYEELLKKYEGALSERDYFKAEVEELDKPGVRSRARMMEEVSRSVWRIEDALMSMASEFEFCKDEFSKDEVDE